MSAYLVVASDTRTDIPIAQRVMPDDLDSANALARQWANEISTRVKVDPGESIDIDGTVIIDVSPFVITVNRWGV